MRKREASDATSPSKRLGDDGQLARGLEILRAFRPGEGPLGNLDIVERTGLPKATVSRLTLILSEMGYLDYIEPIARYQLGAATVSLAYSALAGHPLTRLVTPMMQVLADATNTSVALAARENLEMTYLLNNDSESLIVLRLSVGSRLPIWNTAAGLGYLVGVEPEIRNNLVNQLISAQPEERSRIEKNIVDAQKCYEKHGFCTALGLWHTHVNAVGVPVKLKDGSPVLSLTCGAARELLTKKQIMQEIGPKLRSMVAAIHDALES